MNRVATQLLQSQLALSWVATKTQPAPPPMPYPDPSADTLAPEDHACECGALPTQAAPMAPVLFPDCTCEEIDLAMDTSGDAAWLASMQGPAPQPVTLHPLTAIQRDYGPLVAQVATHLYRTSYRSSFSSYEAGYASARDHAVEIVEGRMPLPGSAPLAA